MTAEKQCENLLTTSDVRSVQIDREKNSKTKRAKFNKTAKCESVVKLKRTSICQKTPHEK
jgi:hypothetical protein